MPRIWCEPVCEWKWNFFKVCRYVTSVGILKIAFRTSWWVVLCSLNGFMTLPSIQELQALTRKRVIEADKQDTLQWASASSIPSRTSPDDTSDLTPKLLRRGIEKELTLGEGGLDAAEYRSAIKDAIAATMVRSSAVLCLDIQLICPSTGRDRNRKES